MNTLTLSPLFRQAIGFDRFGDLFDTVLSGTAAEAPSYPPYNIEKLGEDSYRITMAVAGFKRDELDVVAQKDELVITGKTQEETEQKGVEYLYKGIAARSFQRKFRLADYVKVTGAELTDGLLKVELEREVPESSKPRIIEIATGARTIEGKSRKAN